MTTNLKEKIIEDLFEKGILLNPSLLEKEFDGSILEKITTEEDLLVLNKDYSSILSLQGRIVDWYEIDKYRVEAEQDRNDELYQRHLQKIEQSTLTLQTNQTSQSEVQIPSNSLTSLETELLTASTGSLTQTYPEEVQEFIQDPLSFQLPPESINLFSPSGVVTVIISYINIPHKYSVQDFTNFFASRYKFLESLLRPRQELQKLTTITRILSKKEKEEIAVVGLVEEIGETKNRSEEHTSELQSQFHLVCRL